MAIPIIITMKGGIENRLADKPVNSKKEIVFKNNIDNDQGLDEQVLLFSEIIIDIYLQTEKENESQEPTKRA